MTHIADYDTVRRMHRSRRRSSTVAALTLSAALLMLFACAKQPQSAQDPILTANCQAAPDQRKSFFLPLEERPVLLAIDQGFSAEEVSDIVAAAEEWNRFTVSRGAQPAFDTHQVAPVSLHPIVKTEDLRNCDNVSRIAGSSNVIPIVRTNSLTRWGSLGLSADTAGITFRCYSRRNASAQIIVMNMVGMKRELFRSHALHELGHSLGLNHSCNSEGDTADYPSCSRFSESHPYSKAVMYPKLATEKRESLTQNDEMRLQCLYSDL